MVIVFQVCFFIGIGLTVISLLSGALFHTDGRNESDLSFDIFGNTIILLFRPLIFGVFLLVFSGAGWILMDVSPPLAMLLVIIISIAIGLFTIILVYQLALKPLKKAQNASSPSAEELVGIRATVSETIKFGGFGEIRYAINGYRFASPAKATNGSEIKAGKDVAICWIEDRVFYVAVME
ncbi:MAG: hypothetical protein WCD89_21655 [Anaerocolumna sp.]